jgi:hypothetical protein
MGLLDPVPPPYDALEWDRKPFPEKSRMVCRSWALQGYGTPPAAYGLYLLKIALYVGGWILWCRTTPGLGDPLALPQWWLHPVAFHKAIVWSLLFEVLGLGCGSGPLTGRYFPPVGGLLYFLRPGTTKRPPWPGLPLLGGQRRTPLDVLLYLSLLVALVRALLAPVPDATHLVPIAVLVPLVGLCDATLFLAARGEHYWVTVMCFVLAPAAGLGWVAGAKCVQLALWFWAGVSKLNHHFPAVVCVMTSNSPVHALAVAAPADVPQLPRRSTPEPARGARGPRRHRARARRAAGARLRRRRHAHGGGPRAHGDAARPHHQQRAHGRAARVERDGGVRRLLPVRGHAEVSPWHVGSWPLVGLLLVMLVALPIYGNLRPRAVSFLLAMRYYAGNWAHGVWLFRGESWRKLERLTKSAPWIYDQLDHFYDRRTAVGLVGKVLAFRLMHLHGRALPLLLPKAVERVEDYFWADGELIAGLVLGWNFGDGHLHDERLLAAVQAQCGFLPGELRCIFVESQPMLGTHMEWRIHDAATGLVEAGEVEVARLRELQPWPE